MTWHHQSNLYSSKSVLVWCPFSPIAHTKKCTMLKIHLVIPKKQPNERLVILYIRKRSGENIISVLPPACQILWWIPVSICVASIKILFCGNELALILSQQQKMFIILWGSVRHSLLTVMVVRQKAAPALFFLIQYCLYCPNRAAISPAPLIPIRSV